MHNTHPPTARQGYVCIGVALGLCVPTLITAITVPFVTPVLIATQVYLVLRARRIAHHLPKPEADTSSPQTHSRRHNTSRKHDSTDEPLPVPPTFPAADLSSYDASGEALFLLDNPPF